MADAYDTKDTDLHPQGTTTLVKALFTFVGRDPASNRATRVNRLQPETENQKALFAERHAVAEARKASRVEAAASQFTQGVCP